jgi:REP-associated tyrosine transposase
MAHSRSRMLTHIVFNTKNKAALIDEEIRGELHSYISGIIKNDGSYILAINSVEDHVHILFDLSKNRALSEFVKTIKTNSSRWIKTKGIEYEKFQWQNGFGAFSVSQSRINVIEKYIANQKSHHKKMSFQEELKILFDKHKIEYDERYL